MGDSPRKKDAIRQLLDQVDAGKTRDGMPPDPPLKPVFVEVIHEVPPHFTGSRLKGWGGLKEWAFFNHAGFNSVEQNARYIDLSETDTLKMHVSELLRQNIEMKERMLEAVRNSVSSSFIMSCKGKEKE